MGGVRTGYTRDVTDPLVAKDTQMLECKFDAAAVVDGNARHGRVVVHPVDDDHALPEVEASQRVEVYPRRRRDDAERRVQRLHRSQIASGLPGVAVGGA